MKIYVSEEENINLKLNKKCELVIFDSKPAIKLTEQEFCQPIKNVNLPVYSLEQHEEEIRKQERQKVIAELEELLGFIKENEYCVGDYSIQNHYVIATDILKQKLNQMKGE